MAPRCVDKVQIPFDREQCERGGKLDLPEKDGTNCHQVVRRLILYLFATAEDIHF